MSAPLPITTLIQRVRHPAHHVVLLTQRRMTMDDDNSILPRPKRTPWNKGKLIGAKSPLLARHVYEKIVGLTDNVCDRYLNSEYRNLARALTRALCRKRPSPVASGQPRTWACSIVYVLGRMNFLSDKSFSPHMTTADLCAAFDVGESTVHAKARAIEKAIGARPFD